LTLKSAQIFFDLEPSKIALLKFILEGYDHLATLTILDSKKARLKISFYPTESPYIEEILKAFKVKPSSS